MNKNTYENRAPETRSEFGVLDITANEFLDFVDQTGRFQIGRAQV